MYKKYNFPLNIFMIFEKINVTILSSKCLIPNHFFLFLSNKNLFLLNQIFKNEFFFCNSYLIDASCVDTLKYNKLSLNFKIFFEKKRNIIFYLYYFNILKLRLTILSPAGFLKEEKIKSSDLIFKNLS